MNQTPVNRNYKDSVFRMLFREKDALLSLFNAVNDTAYQNPDELRITTLENAIYLTMKNDVSCLIDMRLGIFEHQSSINPNMPLRNLQYVSSIFDRDYITRRVYTSTRIVLPRPTFVVFYNGGEWQPERKTMRLSDLYEKRDNDDINLELVCVQLNINPGFNEDLKKKCPMLADYITFVEKVRAYVKTMTRENAVSCAIDECIKDGVLADFLRRNKAEVERMNIWEITEEDYKEAVYENGFEHGMEQGQRRQREKDEAALRELNQRVEELEKELALLHAKE